MQDYLLRKGREVYSRLGCTMCKLNVVLLFVIMYTNIIRADNVPTSWKPVIFNEDIRYSQWVIDSRTNDFYANKDLMGFRVYNTKGEKIKNLETGSKLKFDYVSGLVAKAIIEASDYYNAFEWSKPWFYSVNDYAMNYTYGKQSDMNKITLDNMNSCKMYFYLLERNNTEFTNNKTCQDAINNCINDMKLYNKYYTIGGEEGFTKSGVTSKSAEDKGMLGGWFHKPEYTDQMWCDGLYMGPALLAQIINYKNINNNIDNSINDWDLITKQFEISWNQLYNTDKGLLYHAFTANPKDEASSAWAGISNTSGSEVYHSEAFWGRACGWYFLALVDVLEQMQLAKLAESTNYKKLNGYLEQLANGLKNYQDATGCWYQILDEKDAPLTGNYLESSCTAIFTAAYLKGMRLNLLSRTDYETTAINAYKGTVAQFMKYDVDGTVQLVHNCASAGLGGSKNRSGSRDYYIKGPDVEQRNSFTEGKVLGAFILAATEYERLYQKDSEILFTKDLAPSYDLTSGTTSTISIEAAGSGTPAYQWYSADGTKVEGATAATFKPTKSGKYYCEATSGSTKIRTSLTDVTVKEEGGGEEPTDPEEGKIEGDTEVETVSDVSTTTLFYTDFTEDVWKDATTDDNNKTKNITINGTNVTIQGKGMVFDTEKGTMTISSSNMGTSNYYILIPVENINKSVTIEITGETNSIFKYSIDAQSATKPSKIGNTKNVDGSELSSVTEETELTAAKIFIGRNEAKYKIIKSIKITTPGTGSSVSYTKYSYKVKTNYKTPLLNTSRYIKDVNANNETLVNMTFGGWKRNGGSYDMTESGNVTDAWEPAKESSTDVDGFNTYFLGKNAARDEMKEMFTENSPFTLPVRGAFMTMEPTKSGTITAYVIHNNGDFYITNQRGDVLQQAKNGTGDVAKYEFDVIPNETYYLFSNTSAMAFCGASFIPEKTQQTVTAELSETTKYNATNEATGYADITLNRSLKADQWNTLTLPFNMTENEVKTVFGEGTQIIILEKAEISGDAANLHFRYHEIQNILAGYPYLIKPTKAVTSFALTNKYIDPSIVQNDIDCGSYTAKGTPGYSTANVENATGTAGYSVNYKKGDIFLSDGNGKLYISQGASYGKGYRSYIEKKDGTPAAKSISMSYTGVEDNNEHGGTTSIGFTELSRDTLSEIGLGGVYNLNGQRISETTDGLPKGIYIVNGQKIIVK